MRADNSRHLVAAAGNRHEYTRAKAIKALREIDDAGTGVAGEAQVVGAWSGSRKKAESSMARTGTVANTASAPRGP
ncbi:hypothetical protein [Streptomyces subrutilus]|uniref:hypothetical protein n=1 Tax=Streptomyces subrutilus TaxID=36818 RepID=UPI002E1377D8|nr:hypothetical protein OG479_04985 [Streptomyces subrutilus]